MAASTRIKGNALKLTIGGTDYYADIISAVLQNEDAPSNVVTFADAAAGGAAQWYFTITAIQSTDTASFWKKMWDIAGGTTNIAYVFNPWGVTTPTTSKPNFTGNVRLKNVNSITIGGTASVTDEYTFDIRLECQENPTLVTA
jgi:hypothetical protein